MIHTRPEAIVSDEPHDCPYLPGQTARLPLRLPLQPIRPAEFDELLSEGDRRAGVLLYRTECPACHACEPLRIPVERFRRSRSQRRVWRRNEGDVRLEVTSPRDSADRVALYNRHRDGRGLARTDGSITEEEYRFQYVSSCVDTREVDYFAGDKLIGFSILDVGRESASSVYHCFDPDESDRSLGVYSVLAEIELCAGWGITWYYLGLWVRDCASLRYKSSYHPHERLQNGVWLPFDEAD